MTGCNIKPGIGLILASHLEKVVVSTQCIGKLALDIVNFDKSILNFYGLKKPLQIVKGALGQYLHSAVLQISYIPFKAKCSGYGHYLGSVAGHLHFS